MQAQGEVDAVVELPDGRRAQVWAGGAPDGPGPDSSGGRVAS